MRLSTSIIACVSLVGMYWLVVESTCWLNCSSETSNSLEPFCYLNDDGASSRCSIYVSTFRLHGLSNTDWYRIRLANNVTNNINSISIESGLPDSKLEITAFRPFNQITFLESSYNNLIVSASLLSFLPNLKRIYMHNIRFNYIPYFAYSNRHLTSLALYNFGIRSNVNTLGRRFVSQLTNLIYLHIYSKIRISASRNIFSGLTALTKLSTNNIQFPNVMGNTLNSLVRMKNLWIEDGGIDNLEFLKSTSSLYQVKYLGFPRNEISSFKTDTFSNYTQLINLYLSENSISTINRSTEVRLTNIQTLSLYGNGIETITHDMFKDMPNLRLIDLQENRVTKLPSRAFEYLSDIRRISIYDNPLHCDCDLQWMSVVSNYGISFTHFNNPTCTTPPEHRGRSALDPSIYTNCNRELSYQCFNTSTSCPRGSYCQDTLQGYECVCEGEGVVFSITLNACIDYDELIRITQNSCVDFQLDNTGHASMTIV